MKWWDGSMVSPAVEPKISVLIPCFNVASYLPGALTSLTAQTLSEIEIIVIDDGSTDDSLAIARLAADADSRIRVIALVDNQGVANAREEGVRASRGEWIWMVDADDAWPDDALESLLASSANADVVIGSARYVYPHKPPRDIRAPESEFLSGHDAFAALLVGDIKGHLWNKLFRRTLLTKVSFRRSRVHSDLSIVSEALAAASSVRSTDTLVYDYQVREGSIITSRSKRAESLVAVSETVRSSMLSLSPDLNDATLVRLHQYFEHRFILLSMLKDTANPSYSAAERRALLSSIRARLRWQAVPQFVIAGDARRAAVIAAAKLSPLTAQLGAKALSDR